MGTVLLITMDQSSKYPLNPPVPSKTSDMQLLTETPGIGPGPLAVLHTAAGEGPLTQVLGEAVVLHHRVVHGTLVHLVHPAVLHGTQGAAVHPWGGREWSGVTGGHTAPWEGRGC